VRVANPNGQERAGRARRGQLMPQVPAARRADGGQDNTLGSVEMARHARMPRGPRDVDEERERGRRGRTSSRPGPPTIFPFFTVGTRVATIFSSALDWPLCMAFCSQAYREACSTALCPPVFASRTRSASCSLSPSQLLPNCSGRVLVRCPGAASFVDHGSHSVTNRDRPQSPAHPAGRNGISVHTP
jgi:hypothetical protein